MLVSKIVGYLQMWDVIGHGVKLVKEFVIGKCETCKSLLFANV